MGRFSEGFSEIFSYGGFFMDFTYQTIKNNSDASLTVNGSKFFALSYRVESLEDIKDRLKDIKIHHPKCSHICYGFRLLDGTEKSSDDGEPSGSAGHPILNKIKSAGLLNTLVVVIRYFGGIKLGKSGLIYTYGFMAKDLLEESNETTVTIMEEVTLNIPYKNINKLMKLLHRFQLSTETTASTTTHITVCLTYPLSIKEELQCELFKLGDIL